MSAVRIKGSTDPVEVAAVLALLAREGDAPQPSAYERWRADRLRALRRTLASRGR